MILDTNLTLVFKDFYLKSKFRLIGVKNKISPNLLENIYTCQFEGAEYESHIDILRLYYSKPKFG